jgi:zinc protease
LIQRVLKEKNLVTEIDTYMNGFIDIGTMTIDGKAADGVALDSIYSEIERIITDLSNRTITEVELQKVKNKANSFIYFNNYQMINHANNLSFFEAFDSAHNLATQSEMYNRITLAEINEYSNTFFDTRKCILSYKFQK